MAKIQVQGIGMYDDKTLKKKIIQLASDLQKNAKKGDWSKASENGIRALGRMWGAYQDWARQNESVNEDLNSSAYSQLSRSIKAIAINIKDLAKAHKKQDDDVVRNEIDNLLYDVKRMVNIIGNKKYNESINERTYVGQRKTGDNYKGGYSDNKGNRTELYQAKDGTFYIWVKSGGAEGYMDLPKNIKDRSKADDAHLAITRSFRTKQYKPKIKLKSRWKHNKLAWMRGPGKKNEEVDKYGNVHAKTKKEMYKAIDDALKIIRSGKVPKFQIINGRTGEMIGWPEKQEYHWQPSAINDAARELK